MWRIFLLVCGAWWALNTSAQGQTLRWEKTSGSSGAAVALGIKQTPDGGYVTCGEIYADRGGDVTDSTRGVSDAWVVKYSAAGQQQWSRRFGGNQQEHSWSIICTQDGGYLIGTTTNSERSGDHSQANRGQADYWVVKLDTQGRKQWDRNFGTNETEGIHGIYQNNDGTYLVIGNSSATVPNGDKTEPGRGDSDYWVLKLDVQGNKLWDRTLGGSGSENLQGGQPTPDGGCLLVGSTSSPGDGDVSQTSSGTVENDDYWVVKLDAQGVKQWDRRYGGTDYEVGFACCPTPDGGYLVGGFSGSGVSGNHSQPNRGMADYWVIKITATGQPQWDANFGTSNDDFLYSIAPLAGGNYALVGSSAGGATGDRSQPAGNAFYSVWAVGISGTGAKQWDRAYGGNVGEFCRSACGTGDGGFAFVSNSYSPPSGQRTVGLHGVGDMWLLKADATGTKQWDQASGGDTDDVQQAVLQTAGGDFWLGGQTYGFESADKAFNNLASGGMNGFWLVRRDSLGNRISDISVENTRGHTLRNLLSTPDGGLLAAGTVSLGGSDYNADTRNNLRANFIAYKLDAANGVQATLEFGGPADDWLGEAIATADGGYALGGTSRSGTGRDKTEASRGGADFWVVKLTAARAKTWDHRYGGTGRDSLVSLRQTPDGGYLLAGSTASPLGGDVTQAPRGGADYWLVKVNALGAVLWQGRYGGPGDDWLAQARPTPDGGTLLLGTTTSAPGGENTDAPRGRRDLWAVKVNAAGVLEWQRRYGGAGNEYAAALAVDPDGGYIVGASTTSAGGSGEVSGASRGGTDYWLLRLSAQGAVLWDQRLGGSGEDVLTCLTTTRGYGYALGGQSNSPAGSGEHQQPNKGGYDYWTLVLGARRVPAPVVASFAPALGLPGTVVVLTGTGFTGTSSVTFNGTAAPGFAVGTGGTTLTVALPAGASTGPVVVTANGPGAAATPFVVPGDLVVSTAQPVQGTYRHVTVTGPTTGGAGVATLGGPLAVLGTLRVQDGGTLLGAGQPLTGPGNFVLEAGGTLGSGHASGLSAGAASGAVQLTGGRSFAADASYAYTGPAAQTTGDGLPAQVRNLTVQTPAGLTLTQAVAVAQVLRLAAGDLATNGQTLTLLSSAAGTALVDNAGGAVRGTATVQRFVSPAAYAGRGYRHFAPPVGGATVGSLATAGFAPEVSRGAAYNASATPGLVLPFPTVYGYDERRLAASPATGFSAFDRGWVAPTALADALVPGRGYAVQFPAGATAQFVGPLHNGPLALPLTRSAAPAALAADAGWHLVGNPYPSPLDWRLLPKPAGLDDAVYVFEPAAPYAGRYRAWANGFGPAPLVGTGQGFFVRVNTAGAAPVLAFGNAARLTTFGTEPALGRGAADPRPVLRLALAAAAADPHAPATGDETTVYFEAGATPAPDARFDAHKLWNPGPVPSLASLAGPAAGGTAGGSTADIALAINGLPPLGAAPQVVPLALAVPAPGAYAFAVAELANFGPGTAVYLRDALTGTRLRLTATARYACTLTATTAPGRFALEFRPGGALAAAGPAAAAGLTAWPNPARAVLHIDWRPDRTPATLALADALGRVRRQCVATGGHTTLDVAGLPPGLYLLRLQGEETATLKVLVE